MVCLTPQAVYSGKKGHPSTLGRRVRGPQTWSGHDEDEKIFCLPGIRTPILRLLRQQPSCYTELSRLLFYMKTAAIV